MNYTLLAADMDGTVINSQNRISARVEQAIHAAIAAGNEVLFATGRCPAEAQPFLEKFPDMRYIICANGALVLDLQTGETLYEAVLPAETAEQVLAAVSDTDHIEIFYIGNDLYLDERVRDRLEHYHCGPFRVLLEECATWVEDARALCRQEADRLRKINFFFHDPEEYRAVGARLAVLPVAFPSGSPMDYEVSAPGISKGMGLWMLCQRLGIDLRQTIACGDAGNDVDMIRAAGLGVAMGNALPVLKETADLIAAPCDEDGVAEIIQMYLGKPVLSREGSGGNA